MKGKKIFFGLSLLIVMGLILSIVLAASNDDDENLPLVEIGQLKDFKVGTPEVAGRIVDEFRQVSVRAKEGSKLVIVPLAVKVPRCRLVYSELDFIAIPVNGNEAARRRQAVAVGSDYRMSVPEDDASIITTMYCREPKEINLRAAFILKDEEAKEFKICVATPVAKVQLPNSPEIHPVSNE
jgi:hypothetical protein